MRSALYIRPHSQNWNVRSLHVVRPESNYFLRRGYEGGSRAAGPWCFERSIFLGFEKNEKKCSKCSYQWDLLMTLDPVLDCF